jgi:hypothetical protein
VEPGWAGTLGHEGVAYSSAIRRPSSCALDHPELKGLRLIHRVVSHPPHFVPLDHASVEFPGETVFDGVVQTFSTRWRHYAVMAGVALDAYSAAATRQLVANSAAPVPGTRTGCQPPCSSRRMRFQSVRFKTLGHPLRCQ